jgi:hypothetical protein
VALSLDRGIHLLFVFSLPVYIRFVHVFLGIRRSWLEAAAGDAASCFFHRSQRPSISMLPPIPFGRVARGGLLFPLFSAVTVFTLLYCLSQLYEACGVPETTSSASASVISSAA